MTRALLATLALSATLACAAAARPTAVPDVGAYAGVGTWVDVYDGGAFADPQATAAAVAAKGADTLFVETSNSNRATDVVRAAELAALVDAAHAHGVQVVAWYLPTLVAPGRDLRRSLAAIRFRTGSGGRFDSFALDIESSAVHPAGRRNARLLALSRAIRAAVGPQYPLGAIIPSPRGMELKPGYWPAFPYRPLASVYDVFLPMAYASYRAHGAAAVMRYTIRSVAIIRERTGDPQVPIHVVGGIAGRLDAAETAGFRRAIDACRPLGYGLYDLAGTSRAAWATLDRPAPPDDAPGACGQTSR